jgi:hypothetical protein
MKYHKPINIELHSNVMLSSKTATCADCSQPIESWEMDDDDMGFFWTEWGVRVSGASALGNASTLQKECKA